jgi:hypothetical protein
MNTIAQFGASNQHALAYSDLRGADLRRRRLEFVSMAGAKLDGADLSESTLTCVDLNNASMKNAVLHNAKLQYVNASWVDLAGAKLENSYWNLCDLSHANMRGASMAHLFLRSSNAELASFEAADLTFAKLASSDCARASFRGALLEKTLTMGSSFGMADFTGARRFFLSREVVAEVLRRQIEDDFGLHQLVGAVVEARHWCYRDWKTWLEANPSRLAAALAIFDKYPESGCREALIEGYTGAGPRDGGVARSVPRLTDQLCGDET